MMHPTRNVRGISADAENELEEDTLNLRISTDGNSTVFREHGKKIQLICEVEPPSPIQQQLLQSIPETSIGQELEMTLNTKQEFIDNMSGNKEQHLDSNYINISETNLLSILNNYTSNTEMKKENGASAITKDDSNHFTMTNSKRELNRNIHLGKLETSKETQNLFEARTAFKLPEPTINDSMKLDSQICSEIMKELLACECEKSQLDSKVKMDSVFHESQNLTISDESVSNSCTFLDILNERVDRTNDCPGLVSSSLQQFSLPSDPSINDNTNMQSGSAPPDLQKVESIQIQEVRIVGNGDNTNCKALRKVKNRTTNAEIRSSTNTIIVSDNAILINENSEHEENRTPPHSAAFIPSLGPVNSLNSEEVVDVPIFPELSTHLRLLGYQKEKTESSKTFGKSALKEYTCNKKLLIDHLFLEKLFPTEITEETSEENELEDELAKLCLPTSVHANIAEAKYKSENTASETSQIDLKNEIDCVEPDGEKIAEMGFQNANSCPAPEANKTDINCKGTFGYPDIQVLRDILKNFCDNSFSTNYKATFGFPDIQVFRDILKNCDNSSENLENPTYQKELCSTANPQLVENIPSYTKSVSSPTPSQLPSNSTGETESCSTSNRSLIKNNSWYTQLVTSPTVIDNDEAEKHHLLSNTNQLLNTGYSLQEGSDDSHTDNNSKAENSDATAKTLSFKGQLNPELPPKKTLKKKIDSQDAESVPRKKRHYEITMEREKQEKSLKVANYGMKEKSVSLHNKSSQLSTNSKQDEDLEFFHPTQGKLIPLQLTNESKIDDTNRKKAKPVTERTKLDTHEEKEKREHLSVGEKAKSDLPSFSDMDAGMRFKNRNSSLFKDLTEIPRRPIHYRARQVPPKNFKNSTTNSFTMEELHSQIETDLISVPKPQLEDYLNRNEALPSSLNRDLLNTKVRSFSPRSQPFSSCYPFQDNRLARRQIENSFPNETYIQSSQPRAASSSYLPNPRLLPACYLHCGGPPTASVFINVNLPHPRNANDPREVNLLPLGLLESVGQIVISTSEALMIILSWVPAWFKEVDKLGQKEPPPLLGKEISLKQARLCYEDTIDYFTTVFPMMLFDLFFRMHESHKSRKDREQKLYVLNFVKSEKVGHITEIEAKVLLLEKPPFAMKGQLAIITNCLKSGKMKDVFGYIHDQNIYLNAATKQIELRLFIKIIHNIQNLNTNEKIFVFPFYTLSKVMNQVTALNCINISPLQDIIIKPQNSVCTKITLEKFGGLAECLRVVSRAIEKIKNGISLDVPEESRILIIDSPPGTDLLCTIFALIEDLKKSKPSIQKHPILFCTRDISHLIHMGNKLISTCGKESASSVIRTTILVKPDGITDPDLRKFTLEHQVIQHMTSLKRTYQKKSPDELAYKENILKMTDVVLSQIPENFDNSIQTLFGIGKNLQFSFCIVDEAYTFTEPEISLPLLYGINKLILAGDPQKKPKTKSRLSAEHNYYRPLPLRITFAMELETFGS